MPKDNKNLIVALDVGTSKVACLVAELRPDASLEILGMGGHESKGLKKGVVVNIEATVGAIQRALEEAELMADCKISSAFVGIAGSHIRSFNSTGMVAIKDREVSALDVERAIDTARAVNIPTDQQILHVLRQEFIIDGQEDVREPIGMSGVRLEVKVHIVTGAVSAAQNIVKCVRRCGLEVNDLILQPLASSRAVVLTGGSSVMQGMVGLGEEIFHMPGRVGVPRYTGGLAEVVRNARFATAVGLVVEGVAQVQHGQLSRQSGSFRAALARMREWFQRNF